MSSPPLPFDTYKEQIRTERVKRQKYWKRINDLDFCEKLKRSSLESMDMKSLVDLLKNMSPHIQSCSSKIPYTQRSASIKGLVVMRYFYGEPSFFFTYSSDYIYRVLDIRLSVPQVNNEDFPAGGLSGLDFLQQFNLGNPPSICLSICFCSACCLIWQCRRTGTRFSTYKCRLLNWFATKSASGRYSYSGFSGSSKT